MNVTIPEILDALEKNNENTGALYRERVELLLIRGSGGYLIEDVGRIVVRVNAEISPSWSADVATVQFGHAIRYGRSSAIPAKGRWRGHDAQGGNASQVGRM